MIVSRYRIPEFELFRPRAIEDMRELYASGSSWQFMAGGVDLKKQMKSGRRVARLVDVKLVDELRGLTLREHGELWVGAAVTHSEFASAPAVADRLPDVPAIWADLGNVRVRHVGTVAGNIVAGFPQYHATPVLAALGAELEVYDGGARTRQPLDANTLSLVDSRNLLVVGAAVRADIRTRTILVRDFVPSVSVAASMPEDDAGGGSDLVVAVVGSGTIVRRAFPWPARLTGDRMREVASVVTADVMAAGVGGIRATEREVYERWVHSVVATRLHRFVSRQGAPSAKGLGS